jgi:hypothetical protein
MKKIVFCLVFLTFAAGCGATRTAIRTEPPGAMVAVGENAKTIGKTPLYYDLEKEVGLGQALGLGTAELLLKFQLDGYYDEVTTIQKGGGSMFESPRWPPDVFIRLKEKKKQ